MQGESQEKIVGKFPKVNNQIIELEKRMHKVNQESSF
jgi:hypothetical protein